MRPGQADGSKMSISSKNIFLLNPIKTPIKLSAVEKSSSNYNKIEHAKLNYIEKLLEH